MLICGQVVAQQPFEPIGKVYFNAEAFDSDSLLLCTLIDTFGIDIDKYVMGSDSTPKDLFDFLKKNYRMTSYVVSVKDWGQTIKFRKQVIDGHLPVLDKYVFIHCLDYYPIGEKWINVIIF